MDFVYHRQWRIQDFPEEETPTPKVGAPTYYFGKFFPQKIAWKWKSLDREEGRVSPWIRQWLVKKWFHNYV